MHSTQYLYDCEPTEFMNLTYVDALHYKIDKTEKLKVKSWNKNWYNKKDKNSKKGLLCLVSRIL